MAGLAAIDGATYTTNTIDVPPVDEYIDNIVAQGGTVVAPKMALPCAGYLAYCNDPEGNMFDIMQAGTSVA
jgi:predicted enzyme related to lactoylglutathione lyase